MKRFVLALAVCFLLGSSMAPASFNTAAQDDRQRTVQATTQDSTEDAAKLVVEGPTSIEVGDLVVISVEKSQAKSFRWTVKPSTDNFLVIDGGRRAVLSSGNDGVSEFQVFISCALGDTVDHAIHTITVKGVVEPSKPVDSFSSKVASWCDLVESDTKRDDCIKLAQSFSSVALIIDGGSLTEPAEIVNATKKSNEDALGNKDAEWEPFRIKLAQELGRMAEDGDLRSAQDHAEVWRKIARGLRDYADSL